MPPLFITMILVTALLLVVAVARRNGSLKGVLARDVRTRGQGGPSRAAMDSERRLRPRIAAPVADTSRPLDEGEPVEGECAPLVRSDGEDGRVEEDDEVVWSWPEPGAVVEAPGWPAPGELSPGDEPRPEGEGDGEPAVADRPAPEEEPAEAAGDEAWDAHAAEAESDGFDPATGWSEPEWHWEVDPPRPTPEAGEADRPLEPWTADGWDAGEDLEAPVVAADQETAHAGAEDTPAWSAVAWEPVVVEAAEGDEDRHPVTPVAVADPPYDPAPPAAHQAPPAPAPPVVVEIDLGGEPIRLMVDSGPGGTRAWVLSGDADVATGDGQVSVRPLPADGQLALPPDANWPGRAREPLDPVAEPAPPPSSRPLPGGLLESVEEELRASAMSLLLADHARAEAERRLAELAARLAARPQAG